jgi:predicted membrane-bound spermidine synthase
MKWYILHLSVFLCGASLMSMELVASRVLAPLMGSSAYVWTSVIGIILGALSIGYWLGGRLADRGASYSVLSLVNLGAALAIALVAVIDRTVLGWLVGVAPDVRIASVIGTCVLFAPASVLLGVVSPYAIRLALPDLEHSGATVGRIYALSTAGNIAGTFLSGFVLISHLGTSNILLLLSAILLSTAAMLATVGWTTRSASGSMRQL